MNEGTHAILVIGDKEFELNHFKISENSEDYFCTELEAVIGDDSFPELQKDEPYTAKMVVNGDATWYFPWIQFQETEKPTLKASSYGAIFCPFGLTEEEQEKYMTINLILASDVCYGMMPEVWKNLLLIFGDWLKSKSVPQYDHFNNLADELYDDEDEDYDGDGASDDDDEDDDLMDDDSSYDDEDLDDDGDDMLEEDESSSESESSEEDDDDDL